DLGTEILQPDPVPQGAEVVAQVQPPGRPVAGQDAERGRVPADQLLELVRTLPSRRRWVHGRRHRYRPLGPDESTKKAVHPDGLNAGWDRPRRPATSAS